MTDLDPGQVMTIEKSLQLRAELHAEMMLRETGVRHTEVVMKHEGQFRRFNVQPSRIKAQQEQK